MIRFSQLIGATLIAAGAPLAALEQTVAVNDYFDMNYRGEPVSFHFEPAQPTPVSGIGVKETGIPYQVEVLEGTAEAATAVRVWVEVHFGDAPRPEKGAPPGESRHLLLTLTDEQPAAAGESPLTVTDVEAVAGIGLSRIDNGRIQAVIPSTGMTFETPIPANDLPGPVRQIGLSENELVGLGRLHSRDRVSNVAITTEHGAIFWSATIRYDFSGGGTYEVVSRVFNHKPYVSLTEDMDLGDDSRFIFNYQDWPVDAQFRPSDHNLVNWAGLNQRNPTNDYTMIPGQRALARLVIWSQFNYFGGKQETIGLRSPAEATPALGVEDQGVPWPSALTATESVRRQAAEAAGEDGNAAAGQRVAGTLIGGFLARPDLWTQAKVNHVDLYLRPEVPGQPSSRGQLGLEGSTLQPAMEAWLTGGHREWMLFAVPSDQTYYLAKAHVRDGIWPLDRINKLLLLWNQDGTPVAPADSVPPDRGFGSVIGDVLKGIRDRAGLQTFNITGNQLRPIKRRKPPQGHPVDAYPAPEKPPKRDKMINLAMTLYLATDDSAYPSVRSLLPWSDPEAINPFYQGMENMGFYHGLADVTLKLTHDLLAMGYPEPQQFLDYAQHTVDGSLDVYVMPQSGAWWNSHTYATFQMKRLGTMGNLIETWNLLPISDDIRWAKLGHFFSRVQSPYDARLGQRVMPPIGDHGVSDERPAGRLTVVASSIASSDNPEIQRLAGEMAWMMGDDWTQGPEGVTPVEPSHRGEWLQGYGATMRLRDTERPRLAIMLRDAVVYRLPGNAKRIKEPIDLLVRLGLEDGLQSFDARGLKEEDISVTSLTVGDDNTFEAVISVRIPDQQQVSNRSRGRFDGDYTYQTDEVRITGTIGDDGLSGEFNVIAATLPEADGQTSATPAPIAGTVESRWDSAETYAVLRAGQTWGHHHSDKGSMWLWSRDVGFFGDCYWGQPPGGAYGNPYKQGPASGTQLEFVGISNWPLPCLYPVPWVADTDYGDGHDYAIARSLYPFNPKIDLASGSTPTALVNGYDRQVLFIHPETLVIRDSIESSVPVRWRMHSYLPHGTSVDGANAKLVSDQGHRADVVIAYPDGISLTMQDTHGGVAAGSHTASMELVTPVPASSDMTWVVDVRNADAVDLEPEVLDEVGRVLRFARPDGRTLTTFLANAPFSWSGDGVTFSGTVGYIIDGPDGRSLHAVRGAFSE